MVKIKNLLDKRLGIGVQRITEALKKYTPIEWVDSGEDFTLVHVVGGEQYAQCDTHSIIFQYCYLTAGEADWISKWQQAPLTISYYPLHTYADFNFLYVPLGYDPEVFKLTQTGARNITAFATGHVASTEHLDVLFRAIQKVGGTMVHTGENFKYCPRYYKYREYMPISKLAQTLNFCKYTSCLREIEGFELLGVEGLACGARPIVLDLPCYDWYREFGYTVRESNLIEDLINILSNTPPPVTAEELSVIAQRFSWPGICNTIYQRICSL